MFTEGQEVWCAIYGAGIVKRIRQQSGVKYPVVVLFNSNNDDDDDFVVTYTSDGKHHTAANVTLITYLQRRGYTYIENEYATDLRVMWIEGIVQMCELVN